MLINVEGVSFKNFFSFGAVENTIDFSNGINLVTGWDKVKDKSNGSGKTTLLETIPFALFGETTKGVPMGQVINWINKKNCVVDLKLKKGSVDYIIRRGIKPNILEVYENGNPVHTSAHKKDFQKYIEEEVLGMDFRTFGFLFHSNPNNTISVLSAKKPEKRVFLEKIFHLEVFSKLNEKVNEELRDITLELATIEARRNSLTVHMDELRKETDKKASLKESLLTKEKEINTISSKVNHVTDLLEQITVLTEDQRKLEVDKCDFKKSLMHKCSTKEQLVGAMIKEIDNRVGKFPEIPENIDDTILDLRERLELYEEQELELTIEHNEKILDKKREYLSGISADMKVLVSKIADLESRKKKLPNIEKYDAMTTCPTCFQEVSVDKVREHVEECLASFEAEERSFQSQETELASRQETYQKEIQQVKEDLEKYKKAVVQRDKIKKTLESLMDNRKYAVEKSTLEGRKNRLISAQEKLTAIKHVFMVEYMDLVKVLNEDETNQKALRRATDFLKDSDTEILVLKESIKGITSSIEALEGKEQRLKELTDEVEEIEKNRTILKRTQEYLSYIKTILKDEHIKQFAISHILPFLNRRTNHYLSETGHSFYLELDAWLDAQIKGPGVGECSFGNFSGGESKCIDLSLKFAFMDVIKQQSVNSLDVMVLDELLDSSVDGNSLEKLMDIVKLKQKTDNTKVFLISHRDEISGLSVDRTIRIEKDERFSRIIK